GRAGAVELDPRSLEPGDAVERGHEHLEALLGRRDDATVLLPGTPRDDDEHSIERQLVARRAGIHQVTHVDGIEGATEDPDPLVRRGAAHCPSLRRTLDEPCVATASRTAPEP